MHGIVYSLRRLVNAFRSVDLALSLSEDDEDDHPVVDTDLQAFTEDFGITWDEYANFDTDLSTYETVEDWEDKLLDRVIARHQSLYPFF